VARRLLFLCCCALAASAARAPAAVRQPSSWAAPSIRAVNAAGLMGGAKDVASFRGDDAVTAQTLEDLVFDLKARLAPEPPLAGLSAEPGPKQVANPSRPVPMWELDARLVGALGVNAAASSFAQGARTAGLRVPTRFGTEVVARLLGLRVNHPAGEDALELRPQDIATRAEAAYSLAQILSFDGRQVADVESDAASFSLPALSAWQTRILDTAVARIGMPYIWGSAGEGGYDCSGFVWRVYKLQPYAGEGSLASTLHGRTTFAMSGEVPAAKRIPFEQLEPADVLFFGDRGPRSKPAQVGHVGIYLGNGWFIHSSEFGVALASLTGWYRSEFAWARRPLAEAGLTFEG
jgi:hypothetical protein